jgi:hypothetical protein
MTNAEERARQLAKDVGRLMEMNAADGNHAQAQEFDLIQAVAEWIADPSSVDDPLDFFREMLK